MRLLIVAGFAVALAGAIGLVERNHSRTVEDRLGAVASEIAGRDVRVKCQSLGGALLDVSWDDGTVAFDAAGRPADVTHVDHHICTRLGAFPDAADDEATMQAIRILSHESWHLRGIRDEAVTECYGVQTMAFAAERLGAAHPRAQLLAAVYYLTMYRRNPDAYRSSECRNGGALDLHPERDDWP